MRSKGRERREGLHDVPAGVARCPFCHDGIDIDDHRWRACHRCLARHHPGCWDEASGCGTCSHDRWVEAPTEARPRRRAVSVALTAALGIGVALGALAVRPLEDLGRRAARSLAPADPPVETPVAERPRASLPSYAHERLEFLLTEGRLDDAWEYLRELEGRFPASAHEVHALAGELRELEERRGRSWR